MLFRSVAPWGGEGRFFDGGVAWNDLCSTIAHPWDLPAFRVRKVFMRRERPAPMLRFVARKATCNEVDVGTSERVNVVTAVGVLRVLCDLVSMMH